MTIEVYDYREDLQNLVVRPEGRARFRRVALGPLPPMHSHDLGAETFLVLEGEIEFRVEDESVVCHPGQLIHVPPRTRHAVHAVGDRVGAIYLSVAPHIEPTHTFYDDRGSCLPPRFGAWLEAGGANPSELPPSELAEAYRASAARVASLAAMNRETVERLAPMLGGPKLDDAKPTIDELWSSLRPLLEQVRALEHAWNELALLGAPVRRPTPDR